MGTARDGGILNRQDAKIAKGRQRKKERKRRTEPRKLAI